MARRKTSSEDIKNKVLEENVEISEDIVDMTEEDLMNMTEEEFNSLDEVSQNYLKNKWDKMANKAAAKGFGGALAGAPGGGAVGGPLGMGVGAAIGAAPGLKGQMKLAKAGGRRGKKLWSKGTKNEEVSEGVVAISLSEDDLKSLFGDNAETLTEEFKIKVTTLFEAAVNDKFTALTENLEEQYETALNEQVEEIYENVLNKVDEYITYVAEDWIKQNEVAIESALRAELAEDFMTGIRNVFLDNNIDIPEDKINVVEELTRELEETKNKLNEAIDATIELQAVANEFNKKEIFDEISEGLSLTQKEKFATLSESIEFDENYPNKLEIIKEKYFTKVSSKEKKTVLNEEFDGNTDNSKKAVNSPVNVYADFISKTSNNK